MMRSNVSTKTTTASASASATATSTISSDMIPPQLLDPNHACNRHGRKVLAVTTTLPSTNAMTAGALAMIDPTSGSISSSLTVSGDLSSCTTASGSQHQQFGIQSVSLFSERISRAMTPAKTPLALVFGGKQTRSNNNSNNDGAAMLVSLHPSHPKVHWKARLPEATLTAGLILSHCGHYAFAGGASGALYAWCTLSGQLIRVLRRAHYRAITCLVMVTDRYLATGGQDGMVHLWALRDLVKDIHDDQEDQQVLPIRTWAQHAVPITALAVLTPTDRLASASQDGIVMVLETFSERVLARIQFPEGVTSMEVRQQRIWVGGQLGTIHCLDLDQYSMHLTIQLGAHVPSYSDSSLWGMSGSNEVGATTETSGNHDGASGQRSSSSSSLSYKTTLTGHLDAVTSLAAWYDPGSHTEFLASGDAMGTLRIWDVDARVCVRIVRPWNTTNAPVAVATGSSDKKKAAAQPQHGISSVVVVELPVEEAADTNLNDNNTNNTNPFQMQQQQRGSARGNKAASLIEMLPPLQKYLTPPPAQGEIKWTPVFLWQSNMTPAKTQSRAEVALQKAERFIRQNPWREQANRKERNEAMQTSDGVHDGKLNGDSPVETVAEPKGNEQKRLPERLEAETDTEQELKRLRKQLEDANSTIERWQKVNNELVTKLQQKPT